MIIQKAWYNIALTTLYKICSTTNEFDKLCEKLKPTVQIAKALHHCLVTEKRWKKWREFKFLVPKISNQFKPRETKISKPPLRCIVIIFFSNPKQHETLKFEIPFYSLFPIHSKQPNRGHQKYETHARLNNHKQNDQSPKREIPIKIKPQTNTNPQKKSIKMRTLSNPSKRTEEKNKVNLEWNKPHKCH